MQENNVKQQLVTYKTLLTKEEYVRVVHSNEQFRGDLQTNHYIDTQRFSLKASEVVLRVKETPTRKLVILERKKGYNFVRLEEEITDEEFENIKATGKLSNEAMNLELADVVKDQKLEIYLSLSTFRVYVPFKQSRFAVDKCTYLGKKDYELEYSSPNAESAKNAFLQILKDYDIAYKKSKQKLQRAYDALRDDIF